MSNLVWQTGDPPAPGLYWCRRLLYGEPFCDPWIGEAVRTRKGCWWRAWVEAERRWLRGYDAGMEAHLAARTAFLDYCARADAGKGAK